MWTFAFDAGSRKRRGEWVEVRNEDDGHEKGRTVSNGLGKGITRSHVRLLQWRRRGVRDKNCRRRRRK